MGILEFLWLVTLALPPQKGLRVNRSLQTTHSRRETNRLIEEGRLLVNGTVVTNPNHRLYEGDCVSFDGRNVAWEESHVTPHLYFKYHKPVGVVCTTDERVRGNIMEAFAMSLHHDLHTDEEEILGRRVYPIGRLDAESSGLILLTSNGAIVNPLLRRQASDSKRDQNSKEYHVRTDPLATDENLAELANGVVISTLARRNGVMTNVTAATLPCTVEWIDANGSKSIRFILKEGRNRQIRHMCGALGLEVTCLHRIAFAGVSLTGCEAPGKCASLTPQEEIAIGARKAPTRNDLRTPEEIERRKAKKEAKKSSVCGLVL